MLFARIPGRQLTTEKLVEALRFVCTPESAKAARAMGEEIRQEVRLRRFRRA
jgi:hypothetical protein